jgi:hypothetical protein
MLAPSGTPGSTILHMWTWLGYVGLAVIVLMVLGLVHMFWRMWRGNEEFEPGGSLGHQLTGLVRDRRRKTDGRG